MVIIKKKCINLILMNLQDLQGNSISLSIIKNCLVNGSLSHSLIFHGPLSCGKMTTAYSIAKVLNCTNLTNDFCDNCISCKKINRFLHPDVTIINTDNVFKKISLISQKLFVTPSIKLFDAIIFYLTDFYYRYSSQYFAYKSNLKTNKKSQNALQDEISEHKVLLNTIRKEISNGMLDFKSDKRFNRILKLAETINDSLITDNIPIDTIRKVIQKLYVKPVEGKHKVFIFKDIEYMRDESANTFLKGIEEPPPNNTIILITERLNNILPTIKSRCFIIPFHQLSADCNKKIVENNFGFAVSNNYITHNNIWDYLQETKELNKLDELVDEFFNSVVKGYQKNDIMFKFIDKILENNNLYGLFFKIFDYLRKAKQIKYGMLDDNDNPYSKLPDRTLDKLVKEGEILLPRVEQFNLNIPISLTSYFINIAKHYHLAKKLL